MLLHVLVVCSLLSLTSVLLYEHPSFLQLSLVRWTFMSKSVCGQVFISVGEVPKSGIAVPRSKPTFNLLLIVGDCSDSSQNSMPEEGSSSYFSHVKKRKQEESLVMHSDSSIRLRPR